jgi:hypothetical protein
LKVIDSLKDVRYGPDGEIDLSTVDPLVRSLALGAEFFSDRRKLKESSSLGEIQKLYFETIENNFKPFFNEMKRTGANPADIARHVASDDNYRGQLIKVLPDFLAALDEFWDAAGPVVHAHLEDMHGPLKCVFGGDLFPTHDENIASKCGIYTDTIILPAPFLRSRDVFARTDERQKAYYLIKHGLNVLQYKDLACAEVDPPIVVICPDYTALEESERKFIFNFSESDTLFHAEKIFGRKFSSLDEMMEFATRLDTIDSVVSEIKQPKRVLFDTEWDLPLRESIVKVMDELVAKQLLRTDIPGVVVAAQAMGRMATSNELLIKARRLGGSLIIDAPTSWQYLAWKLEYDAEREKKEDSSVELHVLRGLEELSGTEMQWLGHVPPEALIEIRKMGALPELRQAFSAGVADLVALNPSNFYRTTDKVFDNIHRAFEEHQKKIDALKGKKWKFAGKDLGAWLAVGSIEFAAALTGYPVWGLAALAAHQISDPVKLKDIPKSIRELAAENEKLKQSPVGLLFQYSKSKK